MSLPVVVCCAVLEQFAASVGVSPVETFSYRAVSVVYTPQGELTALAQVYFAAPDRYREDSSISFGKIVTVLSGSEAWASTPRGVSDLTEDQRRRTQERIYRNYLGLVWAVGAGRVEAEASQDGRLVLRVGSLTMHASFDDATGHLLEISMPGSNLAGAPVTERRVFSEFDDSGMPMRVSVYHDGEHAAEITLKKWNVNEAVAPELFDRPQSGADRE